MGAKDQGIIKVVSGFFRHGLLLLSVFCTVLLVTLAITLASTKQYASTMKVLVQNTREMETVSSSRDTPVQPSGTTSTVDARVNSEIELLSDTDLMEHLVTFRSTLLPSDGVAPEPGSKQMARAIAKMVGRFDFEPVKKSDVFTITYTDRSPELAQQVLRELERTYLEKHAQLSRPTGAYGFFNREATAYDKQLMDAEQRLARFQNDNEFVALSKEKAALADNLHLLEVTVLDEQAQLESASSRLKSLKDQLSHLGERLTTVITSTPNQQGAQNLIAALTELENRRVHLAGNFLPNDRTVVELDQQIEITRNALQDLRDHEAKQTSTDNNPTVMTLKQQVEDLLVQRAGIGESFRVHESQVADYRRRLERLQQITPENDRLEREVAETRGMNQSVSEKRDAARVGDLLDVGQFGNIAVAQQPTFSRQHVKPRLSTNLLLGAVSGIFLCIATLLLIESTRSTVLTPRDLEEISNAPILATVPESVVLTKPSWRRSGAFDGSELRSV